MKKLFVGALMFAALLPLSAQINYEKTTRLNDGWQFLRGDIGNAWELVRPSSVASSSVPLWKRVKVPHCFNAEDAVDPDVNYYQGPGWYKMELELKNPYKNGRTKLHFEGAGQKSEVYVFTTKVYSHVGGYDEWTVDITDAVTSFLKSKEASRFKGKVPIAVRCDNARDAEMIPSDLSDFNLYGGLYRYVNLVYTPALEVAGLQAFASVDEKGAAGTLKVSVDVKNHADVMTGKAAVKVFDPAGKVIKETQVEVAGGNTALLTMNVPNPVLWSPDASNLYRCEVALVSDAGTMTVSDHFGFRHFRFEEKGPFYLNGKRLLLRGTHRHEDHAGVAAAMDEKTILREMQMMKEMGVNFIRLGHYQQSRIVLEACDRLGILVWEEIPWCRGGLGGDVYKEQARRMLSNMITQHRNHPAVILWGLGNENDWPGDFPEFNEKKIQTFMKELHDLSHKLDPTRLTSIRRCKFCRHIVDVYSPSIWAGWYRGLYTDYKKVSESEMKEVKHFLHVEWGGDGHAGRHAEQKYVDFDEIFAVEAEKERDDAYRAALAPRAAKDATWSETYICDLVDWHLKEQETMPWLSGAAYWPFKDFSTPVRPENPVAYVNQKGVVERDLTPKEAFYVFQSYWIDTPMIRIYGHSWPIRWGLEMDTKTMKVYSNCDRVEFFLNGESKGIKKRNSQNFPAAGLRWNVNLKPGKNEVRAVGYKGDVKVEDQISFVYETRKWGKEAAVQVAVTEADNDAVWIEAQIVDAHGVPCLESRNYINFDATGGGKLIQNQGTASGSRRVQAYNGRARIKLQKNGLKSVVSVRVDRSKKEREVPIAFVTVE